MLPVHTALEFTACDRFTLGIEEELLMASPGSLWPYGGTDAVLTRLTPEVGAIAGEVSEGVLAFATPVCERVADAVEVLARLRGEAGRHVALLGSGVHPLGRFGEVQL